MEYEIRYVGSHVEVYTLSGSFLFGADTAREAMEEMAGFARQQSFVGVAREGATPVGLYILHPNGIGRKSHIANASYAVDADHRGCGIGKALVAHSLQKAKELGLEKGYRIVNNCGEDGGQTVQHLHFHLLGGRSMKWPPG